MQSAAASQIGTPRFWWQVGLPNTAAQWRAAPTLARAKELARSGSGGKGCYRGGKGAFDVIVSNPPYIPRADMSTLEAEVVGHEDDRALCGGEDGLDIVRELLLSAPSLLRPDGPKTIWLEVDPSHPPLIRDWLASEPQASELRMEFVQWLSDSYGLPRFCQVRWHGPRV